jgi:hypothetical protein
MLSNCIMFQVKILQTTTFHCHTLRDLEIHGQTKFFSCL